VSERRLIEEYLPISAVSYEATREKLLRRRDYHISMLHLWWARRPLAAARAAVYAALVPAPEEIDAKEQAEFFQSLCAWGGSDLSTKEARRQVVAANGGIPRKVIDLFAGGGAIPLEATRLGCEVTAVELNPVAHVIELCTLDYPQRFGPSLADDVRRWGAWLIERAKHEIGDLYPVVIADDDGGGQTTISGTVETNRRTPIAYFWTRTVPCPNPADRPHTVPLARQTWLVKRKGRFVALRMVPDRETMSVSYQVVQATSEDGLGFSPAGLSQRGSSTCPLCGASVDLKHVKGEGKAGRMNVELMAVGTLPPTGRGKAYLGSHDANHLVPDAERIGRVLADLDEAGLPLPDELLPMDDTRSFWTPPYGLRKFSDLFTQRQLAMLLTLCKHARDSYLAMVEEGLDPDRAKAVATYLGLLIDRVADRSSTVCTWDSSRETAISTFARQAIPMSWDFAETNPFGGSSGDLSMNLDWIAKVVEHCAVTGKPVRVIRASAMELPFGAGEFDAVITDPPYYDNVPYADLSDFHYMFLKRSIGSLHREHLGADMAPKRNEIVAAPHRQGGPERAKLAYEEMMAQAFAEARRVLKDDGIMVCVYAHQTTAGWATLIEAVRRSGFVVVEAWPLDTEMPVRSLARAQTASLASSIFLVARPRTETRTGDWAHEVRPELQEIVGARVETLTKLGVSGTDLVIAVIGAGMRAYTRFGRVERPNGEELAPNDYLEEVEREVTETILARIFCTDRAGLGRVDQVTQFYVIGRFEFHDVLAPWDELNTLGRGTGVEVKDLTVGDNPLVGFGKKRSEARLRDYADRGEAIGLGRTTIDHLHRVLWLADNEPERVREYLDATRPDGNKLQLVAQALSRPGLDAAVRAGPETEACQRLLVSWKRLIEDNLLTSGPT